MYCLIDRSGGTINICSKSYERLFEFAKSNMVTHGVKLYESTSYWDSEGNITKTIIKPRTWRDPYFEIIKVEKI